MNDMEKAVWGIALRLEPEESHHALAYLAGWLRGMAEHGPADLKVALIAGLVAAEEAGKEYGQELRECGR